MKTTSKLISSTKVELFVTLSAKDLEPARLKALALLARDTKIAGFRKGKAPANIIEKHVDPNALSGESLNFAIRAALPKAFESAKTRPISMPDVSVTKYVPGDTVEFTATAEIMPEVKLGSFKGLKAQKPELKITGKDIDEVISNIKNSYADKKVVQRPAKLTDEVIIDFVGKKDGKAFDGASAKDFSLTLGSGQFIPGFEDGVVGHESGDKFDLKLTFPADYHNKDLSNAKVIFEVLLKQVNEVTLPELDDTLAAKCGPFKTVKELKADIKKNLEHRSHHEAEEKYKDALVAELVANSQVDAPDILVSDQMHLIRKDLDRNLASKGLTFEQLLAQTHQTEEDWQEDAKKAAISRVQTALTVQALAEQLNIEVTDTEVAAKIAELKEVYKKSPKALEDLEKPQIENDIKNRLRVEKTIDHLVKVNT